MERTLTRRIGDVAKAAGVGVETVRFYEREGLIDRPEKPARGWRDYGAAPEAQLERIKLAKRMGFTLADIRRLKDVARGPEAGFCADVRATATARLAAVEAEIAILRQRRKALADWLDRCQARASAAGCSLYAEVAASPMRSTRRKHR